jgi:group II intron reverse transcriptase/maturase
MRDTATILGLIHERGRNGLPLERVYRLLFNRELYLTAYGKIYRNAGAMTPGTTDETVDAMSLEKIDALIELVRHERYRWTPVRRVYTEKKHSTKKRPLGMPAWSDKLLQEVLRLILEAYYEPRFSDRSCGFRPGRGCHTALREVYYNWGGTVYFIEGDISGCFDSLDHSILVDILSESIHDGRFIRLISGLLKAGYLEDWRFNETLSGTPQGSICSPVLANIYLDRLDKYVEEKLLPAYNKGDRRQPNKVYVLLKAQAHYVRKKGDRDTARAMRKQAQKMPSINLNDPDFRRLKYVRYADDFLLGYVGTKAEAEEIKQQLGEFMQETLKLELSKTKTLITHARTEKAKFLGYEIHTVHEDSHLHDKRHKRNVNGRIGLRVPRAVIMEKCQSYMKNGKAIHRPEFLNETDFTIMETFQSVYRGLVEYYRLAYNLSSFTRLKGYMEQSLVKTLAGKFKLSVPKIYKKYQTTFTVDSRTYKGLHAVITREGKKPLVARWGGIPLRWDSKATLNDQPRKLYAGKAEIEKRLLAQQCEICGVTNQQAQIEVHHIRALKDLNKYTGREKPRWVYIMATRRRKTLVVCRTCHMDIQYGRPMKRQRSSS